MMFQGKTVIITGAGRGIGKQTAILMARQGANVVVNDRGGGPQGDGEGDESVASKVVEEIKAEGGIAVSQCSSIGEWDGCKAVVDCALENFGRIDYLINNAGIIRPKRIWDMEESDVDAVLDVNLKGSIGMVRFAAEHLKKTGGVVINVSSSSGLGMFGVSNYGASKEGLVGFTRCIARDLGEFGVRCYSVRPVTTESNMITPEVIETVVYCMTTYPHLPILGNHSPQDGGVEHSSSAHVAAGLAWLCTPYAEPINGREIYVHGGYLSVYQEPDHACSQTSPGGLSLDALCDRKLTKALTSGSANRFKKDFKKEMDCPAEDESTSATEKKTNTSCDDTSTASTDELSDSVDNTSAYNRDNSGESVHPDTDYGYGGGAPDNVCGSGSTTDYGDSNAQFTGNDYGYGDDQPSSNNYGYGDAQPGGYDYGYGDAQPGGNDYGYGDAQPDYGYGDEPPPQAPTGRRRARRRNSVTRYNLDTESAEANEAAQTIEKFRSTDCGTERRGDMSVPTASTGKEI